jgi:GTPase SAR1 family protein
MTYLFRRENKLRVSYYKADGCLLVFDRSSKKGLEEAQEWLDTLKRHDIDEEVHIVLVGNKSDLEPAITTEAAQAWAASKGIRVYFETSAKTGDCVQEAFEAALAQCVSQDYNPNRGIAFS